jgi:hypothetical protein
MLGLFRLLHNSNNCRHPERSEGSQRCIERHECQLLLTAVILSEAPQARSRIDSEVNGYKSYRPDGLLDLLTSTNLTISNVDATYDSSFLNNIYPAVRFPQAPYDHLTLENITLVDKAASTRQTPIWGTYNASNTQITNVKVTINQLAQAATNGPKAYAGLCPPLKGSNNKMDIQYTVSGTKYVQKCN